MPDHLPHTAFVDPRGGNRAEVEELARKVLDLALGAMADGAGRPPLPRSPGEVPTAGDFPLELPAQGLKDDELLERLRGMIRGSMNPWHPGWMGHMDPPPTTASILADLVVSCLNNNLLSKEMAPAFSALEARLTRTFARRFGLPEGAGGVLTDGGSLANLHALAVARNERFDAHRRGIAGLRERPVILASAAAHTSIEKAAMILGLGTDGVLRVATDRGARMEPDAVAATLAAARSRGDHPFALVATAGTTAIGAVDPLEPLGELARREGLWFHVDAAYGGAVVLSPRWEHLLAGIERADSLTFNPQKWLHVARTSAMALFRDPQLLDRHFRVGAPYMGGGDAPDPLAGNLGEIGVQGTRRDGSLKLWLSLLHLGTDGYARLIDRGQDQARELAGALRQLAESGPGIELAGDGESPDLNLVVFRLRGADDQDGDRHTADLQRRLLEDEEIFLSLPTFPRPGEGSEAPGLHWLRAVLLNPATDGRVFARLLAAVKNAID